MNPIPINLIKIIMGILFLLFGRRLFWFYIGGLGFILGFSYADQLVIGQQPEWVLLSVSLLIGMIGVGLALFLQRLVVFGGGFIAGGYLFWSLVSITGSVPPLSPFVSFLVGGLLGGILMSLLFKWTLVILSSLTGAFLIIHTIRPLPTLQNQALPVVLIIFFVLFIIGVAAQGARLKRK